MKTRLYSENGFATLIALLLIGMLMLIGLAAINMSDDEISIAGNELQEMRAFYAAEAGLEQVASELQAVYDSTGLPPTILPTGTDSLNHAQISFSTSDNGAPSPQVLNVGTLAGLNALVKSFTMTSTAISTIDRAKVQMSQSFQTALVPIFQFAVFYGNDLEIAPGADMTLIGRVHSNGNLYVQANNTLSMDSYVTCSGDFLHGRKGAGSLGSGDVRIKDADGNYQSMKVGSDWVDANYSKWYDSSVSRWDGRVQDAAHGQSELNLPLTNSADPHAMIERATGNPDSYETKATLRIIEGVATQLQADGTWLNVTAAMVATGALTYSANKFYDDREDQRVDLTELNVGLMYDNGFAPRNGVVYFSDTSVSSTEWPALRLKNGAELDNGLTVVSENPLYTLGDYNTVNKKPASIMADAITFLSTAWETGNYDTKGDSAKSKRTAAPTTVNASYLTGNTETTSTNYNGGFENLPRFLEGWSGKAFTWSGSAVNLWNSVQANKNWDGHYYDPPTRMWSYDTNLDDPAKLPPETPVVRVFQRTGWKQDFVSLN